MPQSFNPERLSVGESVGGASGAGPLYTDANGLLLDPGTAEVSGADLTAGSVPLAALANLANARVIGRNTAGTGVPEAVTMAQLAALLKATQEGTTYSYTALQTFAAAVGLTLTPGAAPGSPVQGQMWFDSTRNCPMYYDGAAARPVNEVGTWTPAVSFATPGDLSVTYSVQSGRYRKYGRLLWVDFRLQTSAFTFTTASSSFLVTGLPFTIGASSDPAACLLPFGYSGVVSGSGSSAMFLTPSANSTNLLLRRQVASATAGGSFISTYTSSSFVSGTNVVMQASGWLGLVNEV